MRKTFVIRNADWLVHEDQIVMSREESPFLKNFVINISKFKSDSILEVGFGLGISARLIQQFMTPLVHNIVEIDDGIYDDLRTFEDRHTGVKGILGDWMTFSPKSRYDLIFLDPFDYSPDFAPYQSSDELIEIQKAKAERIMQLLTPSGVVCCPHFGPGEIDPMPGLTLAMLERLRVPRYRLFSGEYTTHAAMVCWKNRVKLKQIITIAAEVFDVNLKWGGRNSTSKSEARSVVAYIASYDYGYSIQEIASGLKYKNTSSVKRAIQRIDKDRCLGTFALMVRQLLASRELSG